MQDDVINIKNRLENEDRNNAASLNMQRNLFGYVHHVSVSPHICIVTALEATLKLYNFLCQKDIIYLDATGGIIKPYNNFNKILLYSLVMRHPYGSCHAIPAAEYISSSHSVSSIRMFLVKFRELEKIVTGKNATPRLLMMDHSWALILACLREFCNESLEEYLNRTHRIMTGTATQRDLLLTLIHICYSHIMKLNRKDIETCLPSKIKSKEKKILKKFAMLYFARLVECRKLDEMEKLVRLGHKVFSSKLMSQETITAIEQLEKSIKSINTNTEFWKGLDAEDDDVDSFSEASFDTIPYGNDSNAEENENGQDDVTDLDLEAESCKSASHQYWSNIQKNLEQSSSEEQDIDDDEETTETAETTEDQLAKNEFFMPKYIPLLFKKRLNMAPLWSSLCLHDLNRYSDEYNAERKIGAGKSIYVQNLTSGQMENFFTQEKMEKPSLKKDLASYLLWAYQDRQGQKRYFYDKILEGIKEENSNDMPLDKKDNGKLTKILEEKRDHESKPKLNKKAVPKIEPQEAWAKKPRRRPPPKDNGLGFYRPVNNLDVQFTPKMKTPIEQIAFKRFSKDVWQNFQTYDTPTECARSIKKVWQNMTPMQKTPYFSLEVDSETKHCVCERETNLSKTIEFMVQCDICDIWYHTNCIGIQDEFADAVAYYNCSKCVSSRILPILKFISYLRSKQEQLKEDYPCVSLMKEYCELWDRCLNDVKLSINRQPPARTEYNLPTIEPTSVIGIENTGTICWMNSVLQIICGTTLFNLIPLHLLPATALTITLVHMHKDLQRGDLGYLLATQGTEIIAKHIQEDQYGQQWDAIEFYHYIIQTLWEQFKEIGHKTFEGIFMFEEVSMRICTVCGEKSILLDLVPALKVNLLNTASAIDLRSIIWDSMYCRYDFINNSLKCKCGETDPNVKAKKRKVEKKEIEKPTRNMHLDCKDIVNAPPILVIEMNRIEGHNAPPNRSPLNVPNILRIENTSYMCETDLQYALFASVNFYGQSHEHGHYVAYMFHDGVVTIYNDDEVFKSTTDEILNDDSFQRSTRMLFYRKIAADERKELKSRWEIDIKEKENIQSIWFGSSDMNPSSSLSAHDMRTLVKDTWVNGEVIDSFLKVIAEETGAKVKLLSSNVFTYLTNGAPSIELENLTKSSDILQSPLVLAPVNHKTTAGRGLHWTLVAIIPKLCLILEYDPLRQLRTAALSTAFSLVRTLFEHTDISSSIEDWSFGSPTDIPLQSNNNDCGVYTCMYGYYLMNSQVPQNFSSKDAYDMRYWIASKVRHLNRLPLKQQTKKTRCIPVDHDLVKQSSLYKTHQDLFYKFSVTDMKALLELDHIPSLDEMMESLRSLPDDHEQTPSPTMCTMHEHDDNETVDSSITRNCHESIYKVKDFVSSFDRNKVTVLKKLRDGCNSKDSYYSERIMAAKTLNYVVFLESAEQEREMIVKVLGDEMVKILSDHLEKETMTIRRAPRESEVYEYGGKHQQKMPKVGELINADIIKYVIFPELVILCLMEVNKIDYKSSSMLLYKERSLPTIYHVHLLTINKSRSRIKSNIGQCHVEVLKGDITQQAVHAIVNAANSELKHAGGLARDIVKKGGDVIQLESDKIIENEGSVSTGTSRSTPAGRLSCYYIIHSVGPRWGTDKNEEYLIRNAVNSALKLAKELGCKSIAFPAISCGIYSKGEGTVRKSAACILATIFAAAKRGVAPIQYISVVLDDSTYKLFANEFKSQSKSETSKVKQRTSTSF